MTRNYIEGYFGNLHLNLGLIKFWHIIFPNVRKCYLIIVYLGINVPIYLKHCAIWPIRVGPLCWVPLIFRPHKFTQSLSLFSHVKKGAAPFIFRFLSLSLILSSSISITSSHLSQPRRLEIEEKEEQRRRRRRRRRSTRIKNKALGIKVLEQED